MSTACIIRDQNVDAAYIRQVGVLSKIPCSVFVNTKTQTNADNIINRIM